MCESADVKDFFDEAAQKTVERRVHVTEGDLVLALRARFAGNGYAFFPHVRDATGYDGSRTADAVSMSLWPSRGLEIEGFEIKVSRTDWLKELKTPEKAEAVCRFCDRWWIVAGDEKIVLASELPPTWGLMVLRKDKLVAKVAAPKLTPQPLERGFIASLLRKATEGMISKAEIRDQLNAKYQEGLDRGKACSVDKSVQYELGRLKESVAAFEKASGIEINTYNGGRVGEMVRFLSDGGVKQTMQELRNFCKEIDRTAAISKEALVRMEAESAALLK